MSSQYPILDNRPIDHWKVAELKEELKRRKLPTRGLKDDLIKRLDEALQIERENDEKANGVDDSKENEKVDNVSVQIDINDSLAALDQSDHGEWVIPSSTDAAKMQEEHVVEANTVESSNTVTQNVVSKVALSGQGLKNGATREEAARVEDELVVQAKTVETTSITEVSVVSEVPLSGQGLQNSETQEETRKKPPLNAEDSKTQLENEESDTKLGNEDLKTQLENEDPKIEMENESLKPQLEKESLKNQHEDLMLNSSAPTNQLPEAGPVLGSQVRSDFISTESVSINEKIELKDDLSADYDKLELDIEPKMVEPSSGTVEPDSDELRPMDVEEPSDNKEFIAEKDDNNGSGALISKKNVSADVGYSEKLNLDRSSGDDSMDEDLLENKQIDSKYNLDEVEDRNEKSEVPIIKDEGRIASHNLAADEKDLHVEKKYRPSFTAEKRKLNDEGPAGNNETAKRQRRWNSESIKFPEPQSSNLTSITSPKDNFQSAAVKRNFSRPDSTVGEDLPKERFVPPSPKLPTNSLRIDHFLRPFTLKAVQELLGKTGSVNSFWMDHIKTHCYVTYTSVEEAIETRNAVYNLQWPPNGGRLLVAEFVEPQEVKMRLEAPLTATTLVTSAAPSLPPAPPAPLPEPSPRRPRQPQHLPSPPLLPPPPPLSNPQQTRERLPLPPPPPELSDKLDTPIITLDDLFRKTKATPRIYYLPLSEEQVAAKVATRGRDTNQGLN